MGRWVLEYPHKRRGREDGIGRFGVGKGIIFDMQVKKISRKKRNNLGQGHKDHMGLHVASTAHGAIRF